MSDATLAWTTFPFTRSWKVSAAVIAFLLVVFFFVYQWIHSIIFLTICMVLVIGSLAGFFFPTEFQLTETGLVVRSLFGTQERLWTSFRSFYPDRNGVLLSPFPRPSRLENFRGIYVRFDNNREQVLEFVTQRLSGVTSRAPDSGVAVPHTQ